MSKHISTKLHLTTDVDARRICITEDVDTRRNMRMRPSIDRNMSWRIFVVSKAGWDMLMYVPKL